MPTIDEINFKPVAGVVDITNDTPKENDKFFIDSNVWLWTVSVVEFDSHPCQSIYSDYLKAAIHKKTTIFYSGLSLPEVAHCIEDALYNSYNDFLSYDAHITKKAFRYTRDLRARVMDNIQRAWDQICSVSKNHIDSNINEQINANTLQQLINNPLDGYDAFMLESIKTSTTDVITHDRDFLFVPGIRVFTANEKIIKEAKQARKLIIRKK